MGCREQITQIIYDAIDEVNETLDQHQALGRTPETVLIGENGGLDSTGLVNLFVTVEEKIEQFFHQTISVTDAVLASDQSRWTVADLAECVADKVERVAHEAKS